MKRFLSICASVSLWMIVAFLVLGALAFSKTLAIVFAIITIVVHVTVAHLPEDQKQDTNQRVAPKPNPPTPSAAREPIHSVKATDPDQVYFEQVSQVVEDLMLQCDYACNSPKFKEALDKSGFRLEMGILPLQYKRKVQELFWLDLLRCYKGLGHPLNLKEKEGLGLLYFFIRSRSGQTSTYSQIKADTTPSFIRTIEEYSKELSKDTPDLFLVAHLFEQFDNQRRQQYLVQLYRFASITAKADNTVSHAEAEWLSSIMHLQHDGDCDDMPMEEEEDTPNPEQMADKRPAKPRSRAKTELNNLIGLESVKKEVDALTNYIHIQRTREEKGLATSPISYHCVFTGNPGTGKTTVARILAKIYKSLGVVTKGHLVETDRSGLVAEYVGQTAVKTNKIIDSALDGVLFIDEAYSLVSSSENDYGKEAIATLLKRMEDDRNRLVVILAGYTKEMKDFIDSNPGLQSRFNRYIEFPDYNADELYQIFCKQLKKFEYTISEDAAEALKGYLAYAVEHKDQNFGNARFVRNLFERTLQQQANRLSKEVNLTTQKLSEIIQQDLPIAL